MRECIINIYIIALVMIAMMDIILSIKSIEKNNTIGKLLGCICIWATVIDISYLFSILSDSYMFVSVTSSIYFISIDGVLISLLVFIIYFTKNGILKYEKIIIKICCIYGLFEVVIFAINPFYHICIDYIKRDTEIAQYSYQMKFLYQMHLIFAYGILAAVVFLLIRKAYFSPREYRFQYIWIIIGLFVIVGINAIFLYVRGNNIFAILDCSICCYSLLSFLLYWCCFDYSTHGMLNKLKTSIFDNIGQGIVLFDYQDKLILYNKKAQLLLGQNKLEECRDLEKFMKNYDLPVVSDKENDNLSIQCFIDTNNEKNSLRCDVRMLKNDKGHVLGQLFVFSDITVETDTLTGFQKWENFLPLTYEAEEHFAFPVGVAICDINRLSLINSTMGKAAGNRKLRELSENMREAFPPGTYFVRGTDANLIALCSYSSEEEMTGYVWQVSEKFNGSMQYGVGVVKDNNKNIENMIWSAIAAMRAKKLVDKDSIHSDMISSLIKALEECDLGTEHHVKRTQIMGAELGKRIGLSDVQQSRLSLLCLLHDIGKISIPKEILHKAGKLEEDEWKIMQSHVEAGYNIANSNSELKQVAREIRYHHERWDGKGYPDGLSKESIPILSRVIAIVDSFDAMVNDRPYRKAMPVTKAIEELKRCAGTQFDPAITSEFIRYIGEEYSINLSESELIPEADVKTYMPDPGAVNEKKDIYTVHTIPYSRYRIDRYWNIFWVDDNFEILTGYTKQEAENGSMNQIDLIPEEDRMDYLVETNTNLAEDKYAFQEHRLHRKDNTDIYVFCYGRIFQDKEQRDAYSEIIISDVSSTYALKMMMENVQDKAEIRLRNWESTYRKDSLTGLLNHAAFKNDTEMKLLEGSSNVVMIMMDVDHFKEYNDTYGHHNGDEYLILIAQGLLSSLRKEDYACRMGGDEFGAMLFFDKKVSETIIRERIRQIFDKLNLIVKAHNGTGISMGAVIVKKETSFNQMYREADRLLYKAKDQGRGRIVIENRIPNS